MKEETSEESMYPAAYLRLFSKPAKSESLRVCSSLQPAAPTKSRTLEEKEIVWKFCF